MKVVCYRGHISVKRKMFWERQFYDIPGSYVEIVENRSTWDQKRRSELKIIDLSVSACQISGIISLECAILPSDSSCKLLTE